MDKENVTEGNSSLTSVCMTPRTPMQDVMNSCTPLQSLAKEAYTPITPQMKSDASPNPTVDVPEFKLSAASKDNTEDVALNALIYQKVMAMLNEKEKKFEDEISEKDSLIKKLEQALTLKVVEPSDFGSKRVTTKVSPTEGAADAVRRGSKAVASKVSPTEGSADAPRRSRLKPLNAIPLRKNIPKAAGNSQQLPVKRIYPVYSSRRRSSSKSASSNDEDVRSMKKKSPKEPGNAKVKSSKEKVEKISAVKKEDKNPETEMLVQRLQETIDAQVKSIADLKERLSEKEAMISEQSTSVTQYETDVKNLEEALWVEQENLIASAKEKDQLAAMVQHQNNRIDLLEEELMRSQSSMQEMSVVQEQLEILQKTTKETEYFMEEERALLANELADKSDVIAHLKQSIVQLTSDLETIEKEKCMLQFEVDSTRAKAHGLLFDKAAEMDACLQGAVSLSASLNALHARLLKESHHWGHTIEEEGTIIDQETSDGGQDLTDEISASERKLTSIVDVFGQLYSAVQRKCEQYEQEIEKSAREIKALDYQLSNLKSTLKISEATEKRHIHQMSEAQSTITRQKAEYEELNEILKGKTKALEECLNEAYRGDQLTAELTKCQKMLSQSEIECKVVKQALEAEDFRENGTIVRENISLKSQVAKLQHDLDDFKQEAKETINKANRRMKVLESNWRKSEAEILKMDDLIDCVRLCLRPNVSRLLSFESNSLDRALKELGLYSGAAMPSSTKKK
ncbi:hypothetical protein CAPTEDRAFT_227053 [Capitella teleta]|uniref:Uncharacterized protein n=1 Tax=Capitella teleta TaxID=283909 RepID=R7TPZ0_CAPTE|nr:hypothetical protein CAPTEDRAFT_227053 [Capitella teleta]|eukprot:ELT93576.1 hypothetical protein CAPTEDRAFT_227053 [Capitella teleta]